MRGGDGATTYKTARAARPSVGAVLRSDLDPGRDDVAKTMAAASSFVSDFLDALPEAPVSGPDTVPSGLHAPPGEQPGEFDALLATVSDAAARAVETSSGHYFAYFPSGGLFSSAVAELLAQTVNRFTGVSAMAPGLVALERSVLRWLCDEFGLPAGSGGLLTSGASTATLSALVAARERAVRAGAPLDTLTLYVTTHTHHCVAKAARIAGLNPGQIRTVPTTAEHRMDPEAAREAVAADRAAGHRPFLLVGTAGATSTGTVDPLPELARLAADAQLWFHVDAAYGGGFVLTDRGRHALRGIERADSLTLDPHKSLFLQYGTGALLVRDTEALRAAHAATADYLQDVDDDGVAPDFADLGVELTREFRGLRLWLPLHLHGVAAFRAALDEKLDLAAHADRRLREFADVPLRPDLTVLAFRAPGGGATGTARDRANRELLARLNATGRIFLSSTRLDGRNTLRMCVLSHRTGRAHVDDAVELIRDGIEGRLP